MNRYGWVPAQVIALVGIMVSLDAVLLASTQDAHAESFNIKPGAWEMTTTITSSNSKLSSEMSAKMTPAQRAQIEQMMKARDGKPMTVTDRSCLTKEDIWYDRIIKEMEDEDEDGEVKCKIKVISKSSTKLVVDQMCPGPPSSTTHLTIEAKTSESYVATGARDLSGLGTARLEIKGKWLETSCAGIEE